MSRPTFKQVVIRSLLGCVTLVTLAACYLGWSYYRTVPEHSRSLALTGMSAAATLDYDARGVPTVTATSFDDAIQVQGYLHALHRPFQLELRRRAVRARLAELAGATLVELDQESLELGMRRLGERQAAQLLPETARLIERYLAGVRAGLEAAAASPSPTCRIAGATLEPWDAADVLALGAAFAGQLSNAASAERTRVEQIRELGLEAARVLLPILDRHPFPLLPRESDRLLAGVPAKTTSTRTTSPWLDRDPARLAASNAWAVAGSRSANGHPIVVGDPHLGYELPALWYEVVLRWPDGQLAGASLAGVPGVMIGHNAALAWTFTAACFDDADLFWVEVDDPQRPSLIRLAGHELPLEVETISIAVKDEPPREMRIARLGEAIYVGAAPIAGHGYLMRWSALENHGLADAIFALNRAGSVSEGLSGARLLPGPGLNFVAADRDGNIVHAMVGRAPQRHDTDWDGMFPARWRGPEQWSGFIAPELLPQRINPPQGYVVSANDSELGLNPPDQRQVVLRGDYFPAWRARRIDQRLSERNGWTVESTEELLSDVHSLQAEQLAALIERCPCADTEPGRHYLRWNRQIRGAEGPLLHAGMLAALAQIGAASTQLGAKSPGLARRAGHWISLAVALERDTSLQQWFDDPATPSTEGSCELLSRALDLAWRELGSNEAGRWEERHRLALRSPVGIGPLARWFNAPEVGVPGDSTTIFVTDYRRPRSAYRGEPLPAFYGSSYRYIASWDRQRVVHSRSIIPGGQAEHPASPHAFDQLEHYSRTELFPLVP